MVSQVIGFKNLLGLRNQLHIKLDAQISLGFDNIKQKSKFSALGHDRLSGIINGLFVLSLPTFNLGFLFTYCKFLLLDDNR